MGEKIKVFHAPSSFLPHAVVKKYEVILHQNEQFETERNAYDEVFLASFGHSTGLSNRI